MDYSVALTKDHDRKEGQLEVQIAKQPRAAHVQLSSTSLEVISILVNLASSTVVLIGNNVTLSFEDIAANFVPEVKASGICGKLYTAEPLDACSPLTNTVKPGGKSSSPFALIVRGRCSFEEKVRMAQKAGFDAAIVYDNFDSGALVAMAGNSAGITIHAVFVSRESGAKLRKYAGNDTMKLWIMPNFENSAWSIMAISFISLLAMSAVLATCFFLRRYRIRHEQTRPSVQEFHGMSSRLVKAMPSLVFTAVSEDNCTASTCAICLEDYRVGDKLRVLPCRHKFHAFCVDSWLTTWRTFCPVCKRDARTSTGDLPASESTPLLSSGPASVASSGLSSLRSSLHSSSAIQISRASPGSHSAHDHPQSNTPYVSQSLNSFHQSPSASRTRSPLDLRNTSSRRSPAPYMVSPHSIGYPSLSPLNSRYMSPYVPSPSSASSSYLRFLSRPQNPLHCSDSAASFSPFASAQSLPGC
ncbi:hypothetical protein Nepgr_023638 [Nepenthes gracilis]|uniref:RING-type domain-containing protein n=1 Tax=Nepenthes gracilis TaxID=150966 RepID=A0AAD3XZM3_NEPGR|nr:hypothetical protein Nepgr_023638 [Nepenthes gracilis]